jgi:hypothetical protein
MFRHRGGGVCAAHGRVPRTCPDAVCRDSDRAGAGYRGIGTWCPSCASTPPDRSTRPTASEDVGPRRHDGPGIVAQGARFNSRGHRAGDSVDPHDAGVVGTRAGDRLPPRDVQLGAVDRARGAQRRRDEGECRGRRGGDDQPSGRGPMLVAAPAALRCRSRCCCWRSCCGILRRAIADGGGGRRQRRSCSRRSCYQTRRTCCRQALASTAKRRRGRARTVGSGKSCTIGGGESDARGGERAGRSLGRTHRVVSPAIHPWSATHVRACSRAPQELHVGHEDEERRRQEKDVLQRHQHDARDPLPRRGCEQPLGTAGASSPLVIFRSRKFWLPGKLGIKK